MSEPCTSKPDIDAIKAEVSRIDSLVAEERHEASRERKDLSSAIAEIKTVLFNGIRDSAKSSAKWISEEAPKLATYEQVKNLLREERAEQDRLAEAREQGRLEAQKAMGEKRDAEQKKAMALLGVIVGSVTSVVIALIQFWPF